VVHAHMRRPHQGQPQVQGRGVVPSNRTIEKLGKKAICIKN
jgi:hypothetical protein